MSALRPAAFWAGAPATPDTSSPPHRTSRAPQTISRISFFILLLHKMGNLWKDRDGAGILRRQACCSTQVKRMCAVDFLTLYSKVIRIPQAFRKREQIVVP